MIKYRLTNRKKKIRGKTLYQIEALEGQGRGDFHQFERGGFIEEEANLSHKGNAWIHIGSYALNGARIEGNSILADKTIIDGKIKIRDAAIYGLKIIGEGEINGAKWLND